MPNDHPPASPSPRPAARPPARSAPAAAPATPPGSPAPDTRPAPPAVIPAIPPGPAVDPNADAPDEFDDNPAAGLGAENITRELEPEQDVTPPPPPAAIGGVVQLEPDHADWIHRLIDAAEQEVRAPDADRPPVAVDAFDFLVGELRRLIHRPA